MRVVPLMLVVCLLAGCQTGDPPMPPVVPPPEDLSTWTVPDLVQPPPPAPVPIVPKDSPPTPAEKVYQYAPGGTYAVPVSIGFPLDIVFDRGEQVHNVTDGDRAPQVEGQTRRWEVRQGVEGLGDTQRHHVFVTVTEAGLKNGLTIATTKRTFYIILESITKSSIRVLRWTHPEDETERVATAKPDVPGPLPDPAQPKRWHVGYNLQGSRPNTNFVPRYVVDDGTKMFLVYPEITLFESVPLVRAVGVGGAQLVNARQYLNVVILDALYPRLELRMGIGENAEIVTITRGNLRTIECPGDPACPVFPHAAAVLARRPS